MGYKYGVGDQGDTRKFDGVINSTHEEEVGLLEPADGIKEPTDHVYWSRGSYVCFWVFSTFAMVQTWAWGFCPAVSEPYKAVYGLNDNDLELLVNYGPIFFIIAALPFAVLLDKPYGLSRSILLSYALAVVGIVLRILARSASIYSLAILHASFILNAIAGPISMACVSKLSETWFPTYWRTTVTAALVAACQFGNTASFIVGPLVVTESSMDKIQLYNYIMLAVAVPPFLSACLYLPNAPPVPPTLSAAKLHDEGAAFTVSKFVHVLKVMSRSKTFWVLGLAYGIGQGVFAAWQDVVNLMLQDVSKEYTQSEAGWLGFITSMIGSLAGIFAGKLVDRYRHHKVWMVALYASSAASMGAIAMMCAGYYPANVSTGTNGLILIYTLALIFGLSTGCVNPIFYEVIVDELFPLPEGTIITLLTMLFNFGCMIFLFIPAATIGTSWMNWFVAAVFGIFTIELYWFVDLKTIRFKYDIGEVREVADM